MLNACVSDPTCPGVTGLQCIFPFTHLGIEHNACVKNDTSTGEFWCSVLTDPDGVHIDGFVDTCSDACPREPESKNHSYITSTDNKITG